MRFSRLTHSVGVVAASLMLGSALVAPAGADTISTRIHLTMPPDNAACPKTLSFAGTLTITQPATLLQRVPARYTWIRSDGATGPVLTAIVGAGTTVIPVSETWQLGKNYTGWEALQVLSPAPYTSHHHDFTLTCPLEEKPGSGPHH